MMRLLRLAGLVAATIAVIALLASFYVAVFIGYRTMFFGSPPHCPALAEALAA